MKRFILLTIAMASNFHIWADDKIDLKLDGVDVHEVLTLYQQLTGAKLITSGLVAGRISVSTPARLSKQEAIDLIEKAMFAGGLSLLNGPCGEVRVLGIGENPRGQGVPVFERTEDLPQNQRVLAFVTRLHNRKATELLALLTAQYPPRVSELPSFVVDEKKNTIIVTDYTDSVKRIVALIRTLDVEEN
jgi:general secretion pathway protein D